MHISTKDQFKKINNNISKITKHLFLLSIILSIISCTNSNKQTEDNIKMYTATWDEIINNGKLELFNDNNFTTDIILQMSPENVVGIENVKDYYSNFLTGFSDVEFSIVDLFGQNNKLVKHWNFKGTHTGDFFGIPPSGNRVDIDGTTLVKMKDGKIAQEQDFMDNMTFMQQLGILSSPENMSIIQKIYADFTKGDIPSVIAVLDANVVWNEAEGNAWADGNPYRGPDSVLNGVFARVGSEYENFNTADIQLHEMSNNQVLSTLRYQAKIKKNGVKIDAQAAHFWTLKNGKVIAFQQYVDTKKLYDAFSK